MGRVWAGVAVVGIWCVIADGCATHRKPQDKVETKEAKMAMRAEGPFEVKLSPQPLHAELAGDASAMMARLSIDKQFHGTLEATSRGEMLSAGTAVKGSAGYVAIERVVGVLDGKRGSFALMHTGVMTRGTPSLTVTVVPDSGTGELEGLRGTMAINIVEKKHFYVFEYEIVR